MRKFIIGFLCATVLFTAVGVLAVEYNIYPNPYKILVDGVEKQIEGYNINGYSYFKLRDIGEMASFSVDFKDDAIIIDTPKGDEMTEEQRQDIKGTSDGLEVVRLTDGNLYIGRAHIIYYKAKKAGCILTDPSENNGILELRQIISNYNYATLLSNIPYTIEDFDYENCYIPLDYYEDAIRPLLDSLIKNL